MNTQSNYSLIQPSFLPQPNATRRLSIAWIQRVEARPRLQMTAGLTRLVCPTCWSAVPNLSMAMSRPRISSQICGLGSSMDHQLHMLCLETSSLTRMTTILMRLVLQDASRNCCVSPGGSISKVSSQLAALAHCCHIFSGGARPYTFLETTGRRQCSRSLRWRCSA